MEKNTKKFPDILKNIEFPKVEKQPLTEDDLKKRDEKIKEFYESIKNNPAFGISNVPIDNDEWFAC